jgi:hypothetical protein
MFIVDHDDPQGVQTRRWLPYNFTLCRDNSSIIKLEKAWALTDTNFNYIILCPTALSYIPTIRKYGDRQKDFYALPTANVEVLMQYVSATLLHMLLHVYFKLQSESIVLSFLSLPYWLD